MGTPIQSSSLYEILRELGINADRAHKFERSFEQEIAVMIEKSSGSFASKLDLNQMEARLQKEMQSIRADLLKAINDQSKWMIRTFLSMAGLTVVMSGLLVKLM